VAVTAADGRVAAPTAAVVGPMTAVVTVAVMVAAGKRFLGRGRA
jgi:hypothetical protein